MSSDVAIEIMNLNKCYKIYENPQDRLKQSINSRIGRFFGRPVKNYFREFWALRNISFEIKKGETVGIIGQNGSGKSTLLQLICGTLNPTGGSVEINGRIAALLELGSGFNPEFTGTENIYMSGALLGLSKEEIDARYKEIINFADIGEFVSQPVKTYSSGMFMRLAFAVNITSSPEIMIVDEALSVGDMAFQAKCMAALKKLQENGSTILFVSHDMGSIKSLCDRAILLHDGGIEFFGDASQAAELFIKRMRERINSQNIIGHSHSTTFLSTCFNVSSMPKQYPDEITCKNFISKGEIYRYGSGGAQIEYVELLDSSNLPIASAHFHQSVRLNIYIRADHDINLSVNYYVKDDKKIPILGATGLNVDAPFIDLECDSLYLATYQFELPIQDGNYSINVELVRPVVLDQVVDFIDVIENAYVFNMQPRQNGRVWSKVYLPNVFDFVRIQNFKG